MLEKVFKKEKEKFEKNIKTVNCPEGISATYGSIDIFRPCGSEKLPVIVNIHGGGLIMGAKEFNHELCIEMAKRGFLVFAITYPLIPEANVFQQFSAVNQELDKIEDLIETYHGCEEKIYLTADSAGAFLAVYAIAMQKSKKLSISAGVSPSTLNIKAMGLFSGMFYTTRFDKIGLTLPKYLYGKKKDFPFKNPTNPEIVGNLPPCFFSTSAGDFLKNYTLDFEKEVKNSELFYVPDRNIKHAFPAFYPKSEATQKCLDKMFLFFEKVVD